MPTEGARADYFANQRTWEAMCDEIDMLRRALSLAVLDRCRPVLEALEEYDRTGKMP